MTRLPLTVIGGYLGAGKTTLINRLLAGDHGKRLAVMVNDFGAVNIDAKLIASQGADTIELTNGCVCCTMGADVFMAVGKVLDRESLPDHLIIEASGIGDPARIAEVARAEPDLVYAGIVTIVDGLNVEALLGDDLIAPQLESQVRVADLVMVSKLAIPSTALRHRLDALGVQRVLSQDVDLGPMIWGLEGELPGRSAAHAQYVRWVQDVEGVMSRDEVFAKMAARPGGLYRVKGFVRLGEGIAEVQVVGKSIDVRLVPETHDTVLVGIGVADQVDLAAVDTWWQGR